MSSLWDHEALHATAGCTALAGVDEVGRGPLAGPVVAGAVILPGPGSPGHEAAREALQGLTDSKLLTARARARYVPLIQEHAVAWAIASLDAPTIDRLNILVASQEAMRQALLALAVPATHVLVDGHLRIKGLELSQEPLVKGDSRSISIAAASVLAKEHRDATMRALDAEFPGYGFARHMGYPTPQHLAAIQALGLCPEHRRSFGPCRQLSLFERA